jgi:hypothetical protein
VVGFEDLLVAFVASIDLCALARSGVGGMYGLDRRVGWWYEIDAVGDGVVLGW